MGKKKNLPILQNVEIEAVAAEGKAIARVNDKVVFVQFVVPGDVVDLKITRKKSSFMEAIPVAFHKYSSLRVNPKCIHYGICGGCKWQALKYEEQLKAKQKQVEDALKRIGKIELPIISPIIGSDKIFEYRNKLEFGFSNKRWLTDDEIMQDVKYDNMNALGFHITGAFDKILDIKQCCLMNDINNLVRNEIREYALINKLQFYDIRNNTGLLRGLMLRNSNSGEIMLLIQFRIENEQEHIQAMNLLEHISKKFPQISSLMYVDNHKCNDTFADQNVILYKGQDHIFEYMEDLKFKVGPKSFYQTNTEQAYNLYKVARDFANLNGNELVYDLYTGTGTIANFVAKKAEKVIGIEYVEDAINDAKVNSQINNIYNTLFFAGDMKDILNKDFVEAHGTPDVIITDPPRAGMHKDVVETIIFARPKRIVYVSCNPATQARDIQLLDEFYKVEKVQPVDMFPHTQHVENVVLLCQR
jgi:23S rRNA (uracil1939-C5)-methyltransferase